MIWLVSAGQRLLVGAGALLLAVALVAGLVVIDDADPSEAATPAAPVATTTTTRPTPTTSTTLPPAERGVPTGHPAVGGATGVSGGTAAGQACVPAPVPVAVPVLSRIATAIGPEVGVHSSPGGPATMVLPGTTEFGSPTTFLVTGEVDGWLQVVLPVRPNGSQGWVQETAVTLSSTTFGVGIDLNARTLTVFNGGAPILSSCVAIGRSSAPTPTGTAYITDLLVTPSPGGAYGPYAFGLSSHSDVFSEFGGGDGQVGIHGTNTPGTIGQAVSAGCIRLPNEVITQLVGMLPLGAPVVIV